MHKHLITHFKGLKNPFDTNNFNSCLCFIVEFATFLIYWIHSYLVALLNCENLYIKALDGSIFYHIGLTLAEAFHSLR